MEVSKQTRPVLSLQAPLVAISSCSHSRKDLPNKFQFLSSNFCTFVLLVFLWASRVGNHTRPKPCKERAQEEVCPSVAHLPLKKKKKSLSSKGNQLDEQKNPSGWKLFLAEALWSPRRATTYPSWDTRDAGLPARYPQRCIIPHTKVPAYFLPLWATEAVRAKRILKALIIMLSTRKELPLSRILIWFYLDWFSPQLRPFLVFSQL